jgi:hypothetical protein
MQGPFGDAPALGTEGGSTNRFGSRRSIFMKKRSSLASVLSRKSTVNRKKTRVPSNTEELETT